MPTPIRPDSAPRDQAHLVDRSGEPLGVYRLVCLIGMGGMGSVYRAERADGAYTKAVAIKLLAFDAGDLRVRFAQEQRILGSFSHPHIASLLDVGQDTNGTPYLVMEYVEGSPITTYAREHKLDVQARLSLFLKILDAVQTAHSQLVVHRDIKPGNVLVDAHGEPKLLDFGIAKLLGDQAPDVTRFGSVPLTPEYASPEHVRGASLGTGSDIYSLGVLLFELLTDRRPYLISDTRPTAIERMVCDSVPARPSTHLATRQIGGSARDLDAIVLKALEKQPRQRYASCSVFAEDVKRWLVGGQVLAREPALLEQGLRFLRRHRFGVSVATAAVLALLAGSAVALWQAHLAREQAQLARIERDRAQRINRFLTDTLAAANPADLGRKATVVQVLERARQLADKELANDAQLGASVQLVLAQSFRSLGDLDVAQRCGEAALEAARKQGDPGVIIDALSALGNIFIDKSNLAKARVVYEQARAEALATGSAAQRGASALQLGLLANEEGNAAQAQSWLRLAAAELPESDVLERSVALDSNGYAAYLLGDRAGAIRLRREAIAQLQHSFPQGHPLITSISVNLAQSLKDDAQYDEAAAILVRVLPMQIETLGEYHSNVVWTLTALTDIEHAQKHDEAALSYAQSAYKTALHLSDDNDWKAYAFEKYAALLIRADRAAEAIPLLEQALVIDRAMLPADHYSTASVESSLALAQSKVAGRPCGEAVALAAYERLLAKYGPKNDYTVVAKDRLHQIQSLGESTPAQGVPAR